MIGRYMIVDRLGQGGMASLYLARDPAIDRLVAIKVLREGFDDELRERFAREARSAGSLRHVNIVTIFDVGEHEGEPFIAMEYVAGETLAQVIRRNAPLGLARKVELLEALCAGLGYAHQAGIVHRDIKPANIMVDTEGVLKILDFGIARVGDSSMTQAGMLVGTLNYMSPEQVAGQPVDHRSDIFAVGAVGYELLSYRQAFPGNLQSGILHRILHGQPEPLEGIAPVDSDLAGVIGRALEKDPGDRYPDLGVMRRDLARVRHLLPEEVPPNDQETATIAMVPAAPMTPRSARRGTDVDDLERRRTRQIEAHVAAARDAERAGELQKAIEAAEQVLMLSPQQADALDLLERLRAAQERARADQCVAQASDEIERGALTDAALSLDRAFGFGLDPAGPEAARVQAAIARAREERERAGAARDLVARARAALEAGSPDSAVRLADEALALDAGQGDASEVRAQAARAIEQRRREEEAARAREAVRAAKEQFTAGDPVAAIGALETFTPPHDIVKDAIAELKAELEAQARRRREAEEEARRHAEAERRARDSQRTRLVASARTAAAKGRFEESFQYLAQAEPLADDPAEIASVRADVEAAKAAAEAARERARQVTSHTSEAQQALKAGEFARARELAQAALTLDAHAGAARKLLAEAQRAQADADARVQRARERDAHLAEAEQQLANQDLVAARQALERALALDPRHDTARRLDQAIDAAEAKARQAALAARAEAKKAQAARAQAQRISRAPGASVPARRPFPTAGVAAVVLVLAIAGGIALQRGLRPSGSVREAQPNKETTGARTQPGSAAPPSRAQEGPPQVARGTPAASTPAASPSVDRPSATSGTSAAPSRDAAIDAQLTDLRQQARDQLRRGERENALASATRALALDREDGATQALLGQLLADAQAATSRARTAAMRAGAQQAAPPLYERAQQTERQADELRRAGKPVDSVRTYWKAQSFYSDAGDSAQRTAQRATSDRSSPVSPPPASQPAATGSEPAPKPPEAGRSTPPNTTLPPLTSIPTTPTSESRSANAAPPPAAGRGSSATANPALADEASIRGLLDAYRAAYESLDAGAVHRVQPSLTSDQLATMQKTFSDYRSYSVAISDIKINLAGTHATVSCQVTRRFDPKAGRAQGNTLATIFHLEKNGGSWVIARVEAR